MFENLCAAYGMGPDGFEYEMAASPAGLEEVAARLTSRERAQVLYLGCHGDETGELVFHSGERLSPNRLADLLAACGPSLRGLYLGACFAGRRRLARRAFDRCPQLRWVAGYRQEVDFVDSSLLDVMFFNRWLNSEAQGLRRVEEVVRDLARQMPGLLASQSGGLGFKVHAKGRDGEVRELVREAIRGD
ncbi:hypothetical protein [Phenylobacterium sp.]|uniref:hypothetical protein n=1 Tax=Phenylobacterium sp. TaxID=1871053 RepID=UPI002FE01872